MASLKPPGMIASMDDRDTADLRQFGYAQQLRRSLGSFSSFAVAFSLISVFTGISANFGHGLRQVGGSLVWSWVIVLAGQMLVALVLAELSTRIPLSLLSSGVAGFLLLTGVMLAIRDLPAAQQAGDPLMATIGQALGTGWTRASTFLNQARKHDMIEGQTNVRSARFGAGAFAELGPELDRFLVTTMEVPWRLAQPRLQARPAAVLFVENMEIETLDRQLAAAPQVDTVLAIGGGQAIDLGKYIAWKRGLRLVSVPTILSVDAFVTPAAGIRRGHRVEYVGQTSPDPLVIDYDLIRTAPPELNIAGVGDLLSIHTACFDWELAERAGRSEYPFRAEDVASARRILADTIAKAEAIRACSDDGLRAIVEGYMRVNTLCLPAGHYRVEEGSEHYLFYELEERLKRPFIHGWIVGLGVHLLSRLQENGHAEMVDFMQRVGLRYHPADLEIRREDLAAALANLRRYVESRRDLWYTVIQERRITTRWIEEALASLRF